MQENPNEAFVLQRHVKLLSSPSCLSIEHDKERAHSHYNELIAELVQQFDAHLRDSLKEYILNDKNYGSEMTINIQCQTLLIPDLLSNTA
jgi:hypothetical protein